MSYVYNQKEVFRGCATKDVNFSLSDKLANFYLNNNNPDKQDIEQFCRDESFDYNSAINYIRERKMQDFRNRNIIVMKFGKEYIEPTTEQIKEYENSLIEFAENESKNSFTKLIYPKESERESLIKSDMTFSTHNTENDLLLEDIPKKFHNPITRNNENSSNSFTNNNSNQNNLNENFKINKIGNAHFTTISNNKNDSPSQNESKNNKKLLNSNQKGETSKTPNGKSNQNSTEKLDLESILNSASLGRFFNNYYQHSFFPKGITESKLINSLIAFMKKDLKLEIKHEISITLARTQNNSVLQKFLEFEGAEILSKWLQDIKEKIKDLPNSTNSQNYLNNILLNLLIFCEKLNISLSDLKFSQIGKQVNKIAKLNLENKEIHSKCVALVNKWKKIVEETREKKIENVGVTITSEKKEEDKHKKTDINQSLLKSIITDEKNTKINSRKNDTEQDRVAVELLHRKKHPEKEKDGDNSSHKTQDKNNKKLKKDETSLDQVNNENQKRKEKELIQQNTKNDSNPNLNSNKNLINNSNYNTNFHYNTIPLGIANQNHATPKNKGSLRGILKTSQTNNQNSGILKKDHKKHTGEKKRIKFEHEMKLEKVKIFKLTDEVNAPNITEDEYQKIQQDLLKDPTRSFLGDMKVRESQMEKENLLREKEKAKIAKEMFEKMTPEIHIRRPLEIFIESSYEEGEENDRVLESEEKEQINQYLNKILMTTYFRESDIPPTPKLGKAEMFEFFDENIPKIENLKKSFDSEKPIYEVDFSKIDHIESNPELLKSIAERINNAELNIQSEEEKNKLLAILTNQMKKTEEINKVGNNANDPIINQNPNIIPSSLNSINPLTAPNLLGIKINPNLPNPIHPNMPNQIFPPIQPIGLGHMPLVPPFNPMSNIVNPNNMMNMNLMKNNMNFPNNPNFNIPVNIPNNPNIMNINNPHIKNIPNMNLPLNNFQNRNPNNMMNPGNKMIINNFNNPNLNIENRKNFNNNNQDKQVNFNRIKTKPCRNFHGPVGCPRGDDCFFIHDKDFAGRDIPELRLAEIAKINTENATNPNINNINNSYSNNNNNQNNSFYNNNIQNNRFRHFRNFNNRNNNNNPNLQFNRFQQLHQGTNSNPNEESNNIDLNNGNYNSSNPENFNVSYQDADNLNIKNGVDEEMQIDSDENITNENYKNKSNNMENSNNIFNEVTNYNSFGVNKNINQFNNNSYGSLNNFNNMQQKNTFNKNPQFNSNYNQNLNLNNTNNCNNNFNQQQQFIMMHNKPNENINYKNLRGNLNLE